MNHNEKYISVLEDKIYRKISEEINENTIDDIVRKDLVISHLKEEKSKKFKSIISE